MRLYELTEQYLILQDMLEDPEVDEGTILDTMDGITGEIEDKAEKYSMIIRSILSDAEEIKREEERLEARRNSLNKRTQWLMLDKTRTIQEVKKDFEEALAAFLKNSIFSSYRVSMAKVGNLLLDIPGVEDFDQLKLNGLSSNVSIGERQIPVKGAVNLQEVSSIATE